MRELPPDAIALILAGRTAFRPQTSDADRVLQSLMLALGEGAPLGEPPHADIGKSTGSARFLMRGWFLGGLGALVVGATIVIAVHPWTRTAPQAAPPAVSSIPAAEPAASPSLPSSSNEGDQASDPPRADSPSSAPRAAARSLVPHPPDSLPEEVRLLSKAEEQLNSGHADEALRTLGEHERRFPGGALAEERMAARIQSLCALGRRAEANADLAKLARAYPRSPQLDRARRRCGIEADGAR
jgi:hypothetical protein